MYIDKICQKIERNKCNNSYALISIDNHTHTKKNVNYYWRKKNLDFEQKKKPQNVKHTKPWRTTTIAMREKIDKENALDSSSRLHERTRERERIGRKSE